MSNFLCWTLLLAANTGFLVLAVGLPDPRWDALGPRGLPVALALAMYALILADVATKGRATLAELRRGFTRPELNLPMLAQLGAFVGYGLSLLVVDFLLASFVYLGVVHLMMQPRPLTLRAGFVSVVFAALATAGIWGVFVRLLGIEVTS